jgi:hypothetical protein
MPGPVGKVERPWYMHTHQDDNLIVVHGVRYVELFTKKHDAIEHFTVAPEIIKHGDRVCTTGRPCSAGPVAFSTGCAGAKLRGALGGH